MNTALTNEQRARLHALAKTEAQRLRRKTQEEWMNAWWSGMVWGVGRLAHATHLLRTAFKPVRKNRH
jgi:hypothetical protein